MNTENKHLRIAAEEKGVSEVRGSSHNKRILEYHQASSLRATTDEVPWCASFVNWVLSKSGFIPTGSAMARSYLKWGVSTKGERGDVTILWRKSPRSSSGHVCFLLKKKLFKITVIGGNQDNKVCIRKYWRFMVLGYRKPKGGWKI